MAARKKKKFLPFPLELDPETRSWWEMTPEERFAESQKLWDEYLALGGSLEPVPDSQSPFFDPITQKTCPDLDKIAKATRKRPNRKPRSKKVRRATK
jgi:hypothetical protein